MKLDAFTLSVLKNFSGIFPQLYILAGNKINTMNYSKSVMASATLQTPFPKEFGFSELGKFLAAISLMKDPEFNFLDDHVFITDGERSIRMHYVDRDTIQVYEKIPALPSEDVKFTVTRQQLSEILKAAGALGFDDIIIVGDGEKILLQTTKLSNLTATVFSIEVGVTDKKFRCILPCENLNFLPSDYECAISRKGLVRFVGTGIQYITTMKEGSVFN